MLPSNVTVYKEVTYHNNHIYVPHINKSLNQHEIFADIQQYIKSNNFDDVFIYSHNDFAEVYKFRNNFFNVTNSFENITNRIFLTNGHNHVPFFKKNDNIYIFNIGCAINTSFSDSGLYNYFMIVDDQEDDIENIFDVFKNNFSVQYHTFHIHKESHIYELCNNLNKENYSFVNFIIHDPTVVIDSNFKNTLQTQFNVVDVFIEYDLKPILNKSDASVDSTSLTDLCEKLNIKTTDFMDDKSTHQSEKMVILFSLLNVMFEKRSTSSTDIDKVISVIKKHMLLD
jgi:hypothetical protein